MQLVLMMIILLLGIQAHSQGAVYCTVEETNINLLDNEKFNAQLSRDLCYEAICSNTKTLTDFKNELTKKRTETIHTNFNTKKIKKALIKNFKQLQKNAPLIAENLDNPEYRKVNTKDKTIINLDWFLEKSYLLDENNIKILSSIKDDKKLKEQYFSITEQRAGPNEIKWLLRMHKDPSLNQLLELFNLKSGSHIFHEPISVTLKAKLADPYLQKNKSIKYFVNDRINQIKSLAQNYGTFFEEILESPLMDRLKTQPYLDSDLEFLKDKSNYFDMLTVLTTEPDLLKMIQDREPSNGFTYKNMVNMKLILNAIPEANLSKIEQQIDRSLKLCDESIKIALNSALDQKDYNKNIQRLKRAKKNLKQAFSNAYSAESLVKVYGKLDSISFDTPASRESIRMQVNEMNSQLSDKFTFTNSQDKAAIKYNMAKFIENVSDFPDMSKDDIQDDIISSASFKAAKICRHITRKNWDTRPELENIGDHTLTSVNYIKISNFTFNNLDQNMNIVYHELAHNVDHYLTDYSHAISSESRKSHNKKKLCLKRQNENLVINEKEKIDNTQELFQIDFTGEDYSDVVASALYKKTNIACPLTSKLGDTKLKSNYRFLAPNKIDDDHSNAFYRLLNAEIVRMGKLPKQCSDFLKHHTNGLQIKDCLK